jgi:PAS domain S-box-containing protein
MALVTKNDSIFIDVNQAFEKTFGHTRESLIGKSAFEELNHIITNNETDRINTQLLKDKYINDHELLFRNAEGDLRIGC